MEPEVVTTPYQITDTFEYVAPGPASKLDNTPSAMQDATPAKKEPEPILKGIDCKTGELYKPVDGELEQTPTLSRSGYKFTHGSFMPNNPSSLSPQMGCGNPEKKKEGIPMHDPDTPCKACGNPLGTHTPEFGFGQWSMSCTHCGAMYHICKSGKIKYGLCGARDCPDCAEDRWERQGLSSRPKSPSEKEPKDPKDSSDKSTCSDAKPKEEKQKDEENICPICSKQLSKPIVWEPDGDGHFCRKSIAQSTGVCCANCMMIAIDKKFYLLV